VTAARDPATVNQRPLSTLPDDVALPSHRLMVRHWLDLYAAAGNRVPFWRQLDPLQFPSALSDIWIVQMRDDGRLYFHLTGQSLVDWFGSNPKGKSMEEMYPPAVVPQLYAFANGVLDGPAACYQKSFSLTPNWSIPIPMERVALPMVDEQGRVRHAVGITTFLDRNGAGAGTVATHIAQECWYPILSDTPAQG